ncbi:LysR family transcriptional regulator [Pyxidicoccus caerfyrddinensis]|uniref:LysR family transcriptional regulator n=1 Tax=Pyxidicoccus caerfyrddinensis TaxID=2709663 RepID=UPI001F079691|nr:LysR family transcriptional regulator [Pyxidicoccus caerfyrddinensis]
MESSHRHQAALPQLSMFLAVARHRSFSAAARELGVSTSAVSHAVRQLEELLRVVLLHRTTRAVTPTDAGARLIESAGAPVKLALEALASANAQAGDVTGRVKLSISQGAVPHVLEPVVPVFRQRYPRVSLEVVVEERFVVDFVAEGYDAAFQVTEVIARDMVQVRLTDPFKYFVVGSPSYLAKHGTPRKPEDLLQHECITFRWPTGDALYAWELERGRRKWRIPVRGGLVTNNLQFCISMAEAGLGLAYIADLSMKDRLSDGRLVAVLQAYSPSEPGLFLCYPSRAQRSPALRLFIETTQEVLRRK